MSDLGKFYAAFEERYRGTFESIKARVRDYIPMVAAQATALKGLPAVDLGCGRGEWLELLKEQDIRAIGVDQNQYSAQGARQRGLQVEVRDVFEHLSATGDGAYRVVSAFHVIEHLPWEAQLRLFSEAFRVLADGGMLILEWPNPESVQVATTTFWLDPTHLRLVPAGLMTFMAEYVGFKSIELRRFRGQTFGLPHIPEDSGGSLLQRVKAASLRILGRRPPQLDKRPTSLDELTGMLNAGRDIGLIAIK